MQITNFIVCGLLTLGFAIGLRQVLHSGKGSVWGPILLGLFGLELIIADIFVTDPGLSYRPGPAHSDYRRLGLGLAARNRALEKRARPKSNGRLHPSLNLTG